MHYSYGRELFCIPSFGLSSTEDPRKLGIMVGEEDAKLLFE